MNLKSQRWCQRYSNLERAYEKLAEAAIAFDSLTTLEKEGMIQRFEYTFELAWKTLKDFLESQGVEASFPREVIKSAFHYELIIDGEIWMEMLEQRNLIAHTYDEEQFNRAIELIRDRFFAAITQVFHTLGEKR